jgi:DNA primase
MTPIVVCEGEKCVDAARSIGIVAVCSLQGARAPQNSDWTPLSGRDVLILEDNDEAGAAFGDTVERILLGLGCRVRRKNLGGGPGDDIADYIDRNRKMSKAALRRRVLE